VSEVSRETKEISAKVRYHVPCRSLFKFGY